MNNGGCSFDTDLGVLTRLQVAKQDRNGMFSHITFQVCVFPVESPPRSCSHPMGHNLATWPYVAVDNQGTISRSYHNGEITETEHIGRGPAGRRRSGVQF